MVANKEENTGLLYLIVVSRPKEIFSLISIHIYLIGTLITVIFLEYIAFSAKKQRFCLVFVNYMPN